RIIVAIALFFLIQIIWYYREVVNLKQKKQDLEDMIYLLEKKHQNTSLQIRDLEMQKTRIENEMKFSEARFRNYKLLMKNAKDVKIIFITPTYKKLTQKADLVRLKQTLINVNNLLWIVIEDSDVKSLEIEKFLNDSKIAFVHLCIKTPNNKKLKDKDPSWLLPKGVLQRNEALKWIRINWAGRRNAIVYFGDDDNTYDLKLFNEIRKIRKIGIWPVGIVGGLLAEGPLISPESMKIVGFNSIWKPERSFPIDMASFAFNISLLHDNPNAAFSYDVPRGYQESHFLSTMNIKLDDLEPGADMCKKVLVWHTRTEKVEVNKNDKFKFESGYGLNECEKSAFFVVLFFKNG
uniref:Galactosylgalactosylxylosylprotein 3-beta-glucuronosyltransferase n=1 Tax=Strongyloides stercoralis TaxID=6248 RepID=A0AAF5CYW3_STRER